MRQAFDGLSGVSPAVPSILLYNEKGIKLLAKAIRAPSYYAYGAEIELLRDHASSIGAIIGAGSTLVDYGASSADKALPILLALRPTHYAAIDICYEGLLNAEKALEAVFPNDGLRIHLINRDFLEPVILPEQTSGIPKLGLCAGLTFGNFDPSEVRIWLKNMRQTLGNGAHLLVSIDIVKDEEKALSAYRSEAVAPFFLNALAHINEAGGANFNTDGFEYEPVWSDKFGRVESFLVSKTLQTAQFGGRNFEFQTGARIHVIDSYKYSVEEFQKLIQRDGDWVPMDVFIDSGSCCALHLLKAKKH